MTNKMRKVSIKAEKIADFIDNLNSTIQSYVTSNNQYLDSTDNHDPDELDRWDRGCYDRNVENIEALTELMDDLERVKL